jgi:predicted protein tyrosine phosphatase
MSIQHIFFTSRQLAESLAGDPGMAVISITDPGTPEARLDPLFRYILRLSFYDAVPADDYTPPPHGSFDHQLARRIDAFVHELHTAPFEITLLVHCECGVSRSAAVALFIEAISGAPLDAREFTFEANPWVLDQLLLLHPELQIKVPQKSAAHERRALARA